MSIYGRPCSLLALSPDPLLLDIETPESEDEDRKVEEIDGQTRTHRDSDSGQHVVHKHVILVAFLYPIADQRLLRVLGRSFLLLGFGTFSLSFPDELLLLLLNLICKFALSVNIVIREWRCWGSGSDGVAALGSDLRRTKESIIRNLCSHGLGRR